MPETLDDLDDYIAEQARAFAEAGISTEFEINTNSDGQVWARGEYHAPPRRYRYSYDPRTLDELPEWLNPDRFVRGPDEVDYYLVLAGFWEETGDYNSSPYVSSHGWEVKRSSPFDEDDREVGTILVVGDMVPRTEQDLRVETYLLWSHYNFRDDVFDEGGLWEEHLGGEGGEA